MGDEIAAGETVLPDDSLQSFESRDLRIRVDPPLQGCDDVLA